MIEEPPEPYAFVSEITMFLGIVGTLSSVAVGLMMLGEYVYIHHGEASALAVVAAISLGTILASLLIALVGNLRHGGDVR